MDWIYASCGFFTTELSGKLMKPSNIPYDTHKTLKNRGERSPCSHFTGGEIKTQKGDLEAQEHPAGSM